MLLNNYLLYLVKNPVAQAKLMVLLVDVPKEKKIKLKDKRKGRGRNCDRNQKGGERRESLPIHNDFSGCAKTPKFPK
jgi:hypothetical protein